MTRRDVALVWVMAGGLLTLTVATANGAEATIESDKHALAAAQAYVGAWRGVGQLRRGSNQGAWSEESQWAWQFNERRASLVCQLDHDKYYRQFELRAGDAPGQFQLLATPNAEGENDDAAPTERFTGTRGDDAMTFTAKTAAEGRPARITMRLVAGGDRLLVLYERQAGEETFSRLAEVGSTRKGSSFAKAAASGPECVVTGGLGTIAVEHNGKKYFVCCTGCRDLFRDDPEGVLADYRARKAHEQAERESKDR
jgi:hypothetical protein